jgi:hypothetical protein
MAIGSAWANNSWIDAGWASNAWAGSIVVSAEISGTATNVNWTVIRDTGGTIVVTLLGDTYIAAGTGPIGTTAQSDTFVQSFVAATSPTNGWNNIISLNNTNLVRTSNTVATITVPATGTYDPQVNEIIDGTVQAAILTSSTEDVSTSQFSITVSANDSSYAIAQDISQKIPYDIDI